MVHLAEKNSKCVKCGVLWCVVGGNPKPLFGTKKALLLNISPKL